MVTYFTEKRVWVDDITFNILGEIFKFTKGYFGRDIVYKAIFNEWINSGGCMKIGNLILDQTAPKNHCIWVNVEEELWNNFKYLCNRDGRDINVAFKVAVNYFIDTIEREYESIFEFILVFI